MSDLITKHPDAILPVAIFVVLGIMALGVTAMVEYRKYLVAKMDHDLKADMLDRGMSTDEIQRVLAPKPEVKRRIFSRLVP